ncbi:hypothetical protein [Prosthecomicrobium pneumaticum]|uniref:Uncharacterized protein n=1 Tax=Prosthecomicrobium pneumaticum TaxID=81895 RepID=A0A7W9FPG3_9HYPH|nr:hypothetical protein [Prosthecomicrobium pneumaticum]MBB5754468.1 hypothetical protein [Prosthecomicrobium pneumaticum]
MSDGNGAFEDDDDLEAFREEYEEHREALFQLMTDYADEKQLDDGLFAALVLDIAVSTRMLGYAYSVEKPSVAGLRLELDRFAKDAAEHVREVKAGAEEFIAEVKANRDAE